MMRRGQWPHSHEADAGMAVLALPRLGLERAAALLVVAEFDVVRRRAFRVVVVREGVDAQTASGSAGGVGIHPAAPEVISDDQAPAHDLLTGRLVEQHADERLAAEVVDEQFGDEVADSARAGVGRRCFAAVHG